MTNKMAQKMHGDHSDGKEKRCLLFCCHLRCPFVFPSSFRLIRLRHVVNISVCSFLPYNHRSWLLTSLSVCLIGRLCRPFVFDIVLSVTIIHCGNSHTPRGVGIGGGNYWAYSHSGGRANNLRLFALQSANKASHIRMRRKHIKRTNNRKIQTDGWKNDPQTDDMNNVSQSAEIVRKK